MLQCCFIKPQFLDLIQILLALHFNFIMQYMRVKLKGFTFGFVHQCQAGFTVLHEVNSKANGPSYVLNITKGCLVML